MGVTSCVYVLSTSIDTSFVNFVNTSFVLEVGISLKKLHFSTRNWLKDTSKQLISMIYSSFWNDLDTPLGYCLYILNWSKWSQPSLQCFLACSVQSAVVLLQHQPHLVAWYWQSVSHRSLYQPDWWRRHLSQFPDCLSRAGRLAWRSCRFHLKIERPWHPEVWEG